MHGHPTQGRIPCGTNVFVDTYIPGVRSVCGKPHEPLYDLYCSTTPCRWIGDLREDVCLYKMRLEC